VFPFDVRYSAILPFGEPQFAMQRVVNLLDEYSTEDVRIDQRRIVFTSVRRTLGKIEKRWMPIPSGSVSVEDAGPGMKRVTLEYNTFWFAAMLVVGVVTWLTSSDHGLKLLMLAIVAWNWIWTLLGGLFFWKRVKQCF
jgi:hypothetical protein